MVELYVVIGVMSFGQFISSSAVHNGMTILVILYNAPYLASDAATITIFIIIYEMTVATFGWYYRNSELRSYSNSSKNGIPKKY